MIGLWYEDHEIGQTAPLGAHCFTRDEILEFARKFDPQPFHLDEAAARQSVAGGLIASGWHSVALMMRMICDELFVGSSSQGSPGIESIDWLKPVRPGDRLSVRLTTVGTRPTRSRPEIGVVEMRFDLLNQNRELVMRQQGSVFFGRRTNGEAQR